MCPRGDSKSVQFGIKTGRENNDLLFPRPRILVDKAQQRF